MMIVKKIIGAQPNYSEYYRNESDEHDHPDAGELPHAHPVDGIRDRVLLGW